MNTVDRLIPFSNIESEISDNAVAAALFTDEGEATHAALIIRYNGESRVFHFLGKVLLEIPSDAIYEGQIEYIKELNFIPSELIPSFIAHCELIQQEARPVYGYFYDPRSIYNAAGKFQNPGEFPEYMTCVGFCLTVIQSYLIDEQYLHYADWDQSSYDLDPERMAFKMLEIQKNYPHLTPNDLQATVRRILPVEYFISAYAEKRPARKVFTDSMKSIVEEQIAKKVA